MNSENKFTVIGRLTKDPILRETKDGTKVTNVCVACERDYKTKEGEKIVDFLDFTLWDKNAEKICNISKQGSLIYLNGYNTIKNYGTEEEPIKAFNPIVTTYKHLAYSLSNPKEEKEFSYQNNSSNSQKYSSEYNSSLSTSF